MLYVESQSSLDGRFQVHTAGTVRGAQVASQGLDGLGDALEAARHGAVMEAARQEARAEAIAHAAKALNQATDDLQAARARAEEALSADAVALAVEITRQLLKVQIEASDYGLEQIVRSTLAASEIKRGRCVVHLHPEDAQALESVVFRDETEIKGDGEIARGCVQLETPRGLLVRDMNAALDEIQEQLLEDLI